MESSLPHPIRVLRVITRLNVGGPTRHVRMLMEGLPKEFEQVLAHGPCQAFEGPNILTVPGHPVLIPSLQREVRPLSDALALRGLRRLIREYRPHVVHTHQAKAGILGRYAAEREGVHACVHTYHGHTFAEYFRGPFATLTRSLERRAARRSRAIICQSESQAQDIRDALGSATDGRIVMIPPAIEAVPALDRGVARAEVLGKTGASGQDLLLVLPARLAPVKQPQVAVQVGAALAKQVGRTVHLLILGDGPLKAQVVEAAEAYQGGGLFVHILSPVPEPWTFYAAADMVFLTSRMEGTPLALLEALALGTPVAAPAVGGVSDILSGLGLILPVAGSPENWAQLIGKDLRVRCAEPALQASIARIVLERHGRQRLIEQVSTVYRRILGGPMVVTATGDSGGGVPVLEQPTAQA